MSQAQRHWGSRGFQLFHDVDRPRKVLTGIRTLSAWPVPQAISSHTCFLTDSTLPQRIHPVELTRAETNKGLEWFLVGLCQEPSVSSVGLRGAGAWRVGWPVEGRPVIWLPWEGWTGGLESSSKGQPC